MLNASCPACGAPIAFVNKASLFTVCAHCGNSILREDVNLRALGRVAELQDDGSVIRIGACGTHRGRAFQVVGRVQRAYARGFWNDWYVAFDSGEGGWLSEAMGFYSLLAEAVADAPLPPVEQMRLGRAIRILDEAYRVKSVLQATVAGVEGELPFAFQGPGMGHFVDLIGEQERCATIAFFEGPVRLLAGEYVPFDLLQLRELRDPDAPAGGRTIPRPKSFNCPKCGGPVPVRHPERAMSVVCPYCQSILDTSTPEVHLIQEYNKQLQVKPKIPLGKKAKLRGVDSEVVGFMRRGGISDGYAFTWDEYLLYHPSLGYRFLAETQTGWQLTSMTNSIPRPPEDHPNAVTLQGRPYRFLEAYTARVKFVLGEFYWQVSVGESVRCIDYKAPPHMVMAEVMDEEYIWSAGSEIPATEVWQVFGLPGGPPAYSAPDVDPGEGESTSHSPGVVIAIIAIFVLIMIVSSFGSCSGSGGSGGFFVGGK